MDGYINVVYKNAYAMENELQIQHFRRYFEMEFILLWVGIRGKKTNKLKQNL